MKTKALRALVQIYSPKISSAPPGYFRGHQGQTMSGGREEGRPWLMVKVGLRYVLYGTLAVWKDLGMCPNLSWLYSGSLYTWNETACRSSCEREEINQRCNDRLHLGLSYMLMLRVVSGFNHLIIVVIVVLSCLANACTLNEHKESTSNLIVQIITPLLGLS